MAESWFRHDTNARNDIKLVKLRRKGLDRIGLFWCVVEMLRETEGWRIPLDDIEDILFDLRCENVVFNDLFECGLLEKDELFFWSNSLVKRMEEYEIVVQKRRDAGSKGGKKKADNIAIVASAKQMPSKIVASAKQNCSKSLANRFELNRFELNGFELNGFENNENNTIATAPHEYYLSVWNDLFKCETITTSAIERECIYKLKGLTREQVRTTIEKYNNALESDSSWIETKVDAFSFLTDLKYGFNWFVNATPEMLKRKGNKQNFKQKSSYGNYEAVIDENGEEMPF